VIIHPPLSRSSRIAASPFLRLQPDLLPFLHLSRPREALSTALPLPISLPSPTVSHHLFLGVLPRSPLPSCSRSTARRERQAGKGAGEKKTGGRNVGESSMTFPCWFSRFSPSFLHLSSSSSSDARWSLPPFPSLSSPSLLRASPPDPSSALPPSSPPLPPPSPPPRVTSECQ
jgi:hypothetical protein